MNRRAALTGVSLVALAVLSGCTATQTSGFLQSNGVSQATADRIGSIESTAVADGTLFCLINGAIAVVPGVNVKGAASDKVAAACASAQLIGGVLASTVPVPVPPPMSGGPVPVATTPPIAAAAVAASVKPKS